MVSLPKTELCRRLPVFALKVPTNQVARDPINRATGSFASVVCGRTKRDNLDLVLNRPIIR
jgi:hypothetical protein